MNGRRGFLRGLGLFSAVLGGSAVYANGQPSRSPTPLVDNSNNTNTGDIDHLKPLGHDNICLTSTNRPLQQYSFNSNNSLTIGVQGYQAYVVTDNTPVVQRNEVKMAVGKDNRLWIEVDGSWKRVALEG